MPSFIIALTLRLQVGLTTKDHAGQKMEGKGHSFLSLLQNRERETTRKSCTLSVGRFATISGRLEFEWIG